MDSENRELKAFAAIQPVIDEFAPILKGFAVGRYAIAISGSYGKGTSDGNSDLDFRLYAGDIPATFSEIREAVRKPTAEWAKKGITIDDAGPRKIGEVDEALAKWLDGNSQADNHVWTVWGYHLLPDLYHQHVIDDPFSIVADWKTQLRAYLPKLKKAVLDKHLGALRYWWYDYHYANKVRRQDEVFLAGLSAKLVHNMIQVLFALNETYYVGDGHNLGFATRLPFQPPDVVKRIRAILYPVLSEAVFEEQRNMLVSLIDDVERLALSLGYGIE